MSIAAKSRHLRLYAELTKLLVKYGRSDLVRDMRAAGFDGGVAELAAPDIEDGEVPPEAEQLAGDLEALGPTFIKLGQLLSTRVDLLPTAYTEALSRLQDDVEPISSEEVERVFWEELGVDTRTAFASFDREPLASASLGQVHRAELRSGRSVVVKVQRPGIRDRIKEDMEALSELATWLDDHTDVGRRFGFAELLSEFDHSLRDELDYKREASNLRRLATIVEPYELLVVPQPVDDFTSGRVLTMDYLEGRKITSLTPLARLEMDTSASDLADQLFRAYLDQILVEGFFHADPHPGNICLTTDGRIAMLDLGMVARVPNRLQDLLVKLLVAVSGGRGEEAAHLTMQMGRPLDDFDESRFVRGASDLVTRNHDLGVGELDAGGLVMQLQRLSGESGLRLPPELALLGKALLNLDQVARSLDPEFSPSDAIQRHATTILQSRMRPSRERLFSAALEAREFIEELPGRVNKLLDSTANGELTLKVDAFDEKELLRGLQQLANRVTTGLVLAALIIGAAMLTRVQTDVELFGYPAVAIVCFLAASLGGAALLWTIAGGARRDRQGRRR
ncbi:MAG TPA: AarF/UbiB family protein [Acidimicrobiales bacterium]|nr:AarF/UbiB family protein [Acidimicrobiales bacterium]